MDIVDIIAGLLFGGLLVLTLMYSYEMATKGTLHLEFNSENIPLWIALFFVVFLLSSYIGAFGRGESSPLPWKAFLLTLDDEGLWWALVAFVSVIIVDSWIFWIPGQIILNKISNTTTSVRIGIRFLNTLLGITLIFEGNPIYQFIKSIFDFFD